MKVRAKRLANAMGHEVSGSSWLAIGREYVVLAIYTNVAATTPSVSIVLAAGEGGHDFAFFDLADFEITDPRLSGLWRVALDGHNLAIEPEAWADIESFWEVLNGDIPVAQVLGDHGPQVDAKRRYNSAVRELYAEAGTPLPDGWVATAANE